MRFPSSCRTPTASDCTPFPTTACFAPHSRDLPFFRLGMALRCQFAAAPQGPPDDRTDPPRCREGEPEDGLRGCDHLWIHPQPCIARVCPNSPICGRFGVGGGGAPVGCRLRSKLLIAGQPLIEINGCSLQPLMGHWSRGGALTNSSGPGLVRELLGGVVQEVKGGDSRVPYVDKSCFECDQLRLCIIFNTSQLFVVPTRP